MGATIVTILAVASIFLAISFSRLIEILFKKFVQARYMNIRSFPLVNRLKIILEIRGWAYYRGTEGLELVEFQGDSPDMSKKKVTIQFIVDYKLGEVEPYSLMINGESKNEEEFLKIMDEIFKVQNPFDIEDGLQVKEVDSRALYPLLFLYIRK